MMVHFSFWGEVSFNISYKEPHKFHMLKNTHGIFSCETHVITQMSIFFKEF